MARKTYLQLVNAVLTKLREDQVTSVNTSIYGRLIGAMVNEAKREVEDSYGWNALKDSLLINTTPAGFSYVLTGSGQRATVIDAYNITASMEMRPATTAFMNNLLTISASTGDPIYYNFNGTDSNGDSMIDVYPVPTGVSQLSFNMIIPQDDLTEDTDTLYVPDEPVILNAYARAVVERGEDGGIQSSEAYALFRRSLANHIAIDKSRQPDELVWIPK